MTSGGFVENAIQKIASGAATVQSIGNLLASSGYTPDAQKAIMDIIKSDPSVQSRTTGAGAATSAPVSQTNQSGLYTNGYTSYAGKSGYTPIGGGYYRTADGKIVSDSSARRN
jgi:hypothetical protein